MTNELFNQLWEWSYLEGSFTIRDFAKSIEMTYKTIYDLSKENKDWEHVFNVVRARLAYNAELAFHTRKISTKAWSKYSYENEYLFKEFYLEENGVDVPEVAENEDVFDEWLKKQILKDKKAFG